MMMRFILFTTLSTLLSGCFYLTQDGMFHAHYKRLNDRMVGVKSETGPACSADPSLEICKKIIVDAEHYEYAYTFVSPYSKNKGPCRTITRVRRSDHIIVGWRFEGAREDCLRSPK